MIFSDVDDDPEFVEAAEEWAEGATPDTIIEAARDSDTTPRCLRCGSLVKTGGDAAHPAFETMVEYAPTTCWRSMAGTWVYCSRPPRELLLTERGDL